MDGIARVLDGSLVSTLLLLLGLVLLIATVTVWYMMDGKHSSAAPLERAVASLRRRLVQGQITLDEFERLRGQLEASAKSTRNTA